MCHVFLFFSSRFLSMVPWSFSVMLLLYFCPPAPTHHLHLPCLFGQLEELDSFHQGKHLLDFPLNYIKALDLKTGFGIQRGPTLPGVCERILQPSGVFVLGTVPPWILYVLVSLPVQYCKHGMCVNKELDLQPVHGEWGPWGPYSVCSRSCGGGTRSTSRDCNKPE